MATSGRLGAAGMLVAGWGLALMSSDGEMLQDAMIGLLVVGSMTAVVMHARRKVEATAAARYRDGYADGYVDGVADRQPRPERTLRLIR